MPPFQRTMLKLLAMEVTNFLILHYEIETPITIFSIKTRPCYLMTVHWGGGGENLHKARSLSPCSPKRECFGKKGKKDFRKTFKFRSNFAPRSKNWFWIEPPPPPPPPLFASSVGTHARIICANPNEKLNRTLYYNYTLYRCYLPRARRPRFIRGLEREQKAVAYRPSIFTENDSIRFSRLWPPLFSRRVKYFFSLSLFLLYSIPFVLFINVHVYIISRERERNWSGENVYRSSIYLENRNYYTSSRNSSKLCYLG